LLNDTVITDAMNVPIVSAINPRGPVRTLVSAQ